MFFMACRLVDNLLAALLVSSYSDCVRNLFIRLVIFSIFIGNFLSNLLSVLCSFLLQLFLISLLLKFMG